MPKRKGLFRLSIILLIIWLILIRLGKEKASQSELSLATAIYLICCFPFLIYFVRSEKKIPYLPVFGFFYFVYFGLSIFNKYNLFQIANLTPEIITKCLNLALFGFISLMVAFYTPLGKVIDLIVIPLKIPWDPNKAYRLGISLGFLGIIVYYLSLSALLPFSFSGLVNFINGLSYLGIAILFMLQLQNKLKFSGKIFLWLGLFIPRVFFDLSSGASFLIIVDFILLFFLYFYYYRSIPWLRVIMALVIFLAIFSARDRFRELTWFEGEYTHYRPVEKGVLYIKLIYENLSGKEKPYREAYELLSLRTDYLVTFAQVVQVTPDYIPYWGGYTYRTLLTTLIPRFIIPGKPQKILGQEFGHRYMLLSPDDFSTSYNLPMLIEMYINFGQLGIIIGMFILGLIFRIFYSLFNHEAAGEGGFLISVMIFINLLNIESDFSLMFGAILQYIILFYIIIRRMKLPIKRLDREDKR